MVLRFLAEGEEDVADLREGIVDLDIGVFSQEGPEIRTQKLFDDVYVGIARKDHPFLKRTMTVARFCEAEHLGGFPARKDPCSDRQSSGQAGSV